MSIEQIIEYLNNHQDEYSFSLREYVSPNAEYYLEAVVNHSIVSDTIGIIMEENVFTPVLTYSKSEMLATFARLEEKSLRIISLLKDASLKFDNTYVGGNNN